MGDPHAFLSQGRRAPAHRPVATRVHDWQELFEPFSRPEASEQASRCMSCGIPYCHAACPLGNLISDWNDLAYRGRWRDASERLHATNNFPELTGRLCPELCEAACALSINDEPVTNAVVEKQIAEVAWSEGWVVPQRPGAQTAKRVGVVGSGPAGLAAAQQLARAGHQVTVFERARRAGGVLRYGIPDFKLEKWVLERRLSQLRAEGVSFRCGVEMGTDIAAGELIGAGGDFDALVLAGGATAARDLDVPGRDLLGVHQAVEYLVTANKVLEGEAAPSPTLTAAGKDVVVIGGGDTGADCLGTALRQGAASVHQLEIMPRPAQGRDPAVPWLAWPRPLRSSAAHHEGGEREWSVSTRRFLDDGHGRVAGLEVADVTMNMHDERPRFEPVPGSERVIAAELVLLALGFSGPEHSPMLAQLGVSLNARGNVARDDHWATDVPGVFACGDMGRGQSLVAWAIAEGRSTAAAVDRWLMGDTLLPSSLPFAPA
ncbi:MAG: glutamate synthase subunit beta [Acidimicrobiales bacterium]